MRKSLNPLTPTPVYRYAVQACQPHLQLRDATNIAAQTILTVLFAAAARISSLSDTGRQLRGVPDEHVVAEALYATLPEYNALRRRVQAARHGHRPKALRRRPQVVALDLTVLPFYGVDAKTNPEVVRGQAQKGTCSFYGDGTADVLRKGQRYTIALTAVIRSMTLADLARDLLQQVRAAGVKVRFLVLDREFYSGAVLRYLQAARTPFLMPVVCHGRPADHPLGPSGSNVFQQCQTSGWSEYTLTDATKRTATVLVCIKCRKSPRHAGPARPRAPDLCLRGDRSAAVRLGQGDVPAEVRDRDQLSSDEPVSDPDDDDAVRGAVPVRGDRIVASELVDLAASRRALPAASRRRRTAPGAAAVEDDAAVALRGGRRDVWPGEDTIDRKTFAKHDYDVAPRKL
jgi:hypothetical protein